MTKSLSVMSRYMILNFATGCQQQQLIAITRMDIVVHSGDIPE